jgi:hypothetical protein
VFTESDESLLAALEEQALAIVRQLAPAKHQTPSTVYSHLGQRLGSTVRYLNWVSHTLSAADKLLRARVSLQLTDCSKPRGARRGTAFSHLINHGFISRQIPNAFGFLKTHYPLKRTTNNFEHKGDGDDCMESDRFLPDCSTSKRKQI